MLKVRSCGVRRGVVLFGKEGGDSWQGKVQCGRADHGEVLYCKARHGFIKARCSMARLCEALSC